MKQCPNCQANINDTAKFCVKCGFNVKKYEEEKARPAVMFCHECGTKIEEGSFCPECGTKIDEEFGTANFDDIFGDGWLSGLESMTQASVEDKKIQNTKAETEKALAPFLYEEHSDGSYTVTGLKDRYALNVTLPKGVVAIGNSAFEGSEVMKVSLPEGLLKIGNCAFKGAWDLSEINFPRSLVSVGSEAFMDCRLLDIELPKTLRNIGKDAMKNTVRDIQRAKEEEERLKAEEARRAEEAKKAAEAQKALEIQDKDILEKYNEACNYDEGCGVNVDHKKAFQIWKELADMGDARSMYRVGCCYEKSYYGVTQDFNAAQKYKRLAVENGDGRSMFETKFDPAYRACQGSGEIPDEIKELATQAMTAMVEQMRHYGDIRIINDTYTTFTQYGSKVFNYERYEEMKAEFASILFRSAKEFAEQGYVYAEFVLSYCYSDGIGTQKDYKESERWRMIAAGHNCGNAMTRFWMDGFFGDSYTADQWKWLEKAVENGHVSAMSSMVYYYRTIGDTAEADRLHKKFMCNDEYRDFECQNN